MSKVIEVKTTDNQKLFLNPQLVAAVEEVPASVRVEAHSKVYSAGFKFLVQLNAEELLTKLGYQVQK